MSKPRDPQAAFEEVALPHLDQLYAGALRMTHQRESAEDLVQDTLLRAYRFFDRFEPGTNAKAWLFKIMTNLFINQYRKEAATPDQTELENLDSLYTQVVGAYLDHLDRGPERRVMVQVEAEVVREAIDMLPENFRLPVVLADLQGFSYKEIADILEIPIGTVMSRLFRGRKQLQITLLEYAQTHGYVPQGLG